MKNVFLTTIVFTTLLLGINSCSKEPSISPTNQLVGTTWRLDSGNVYVPEHGAYEMLEYGDVYLLTWTFERDSILLVLPYSSERVYYRISNDTLYSALWETGFGVMTFTTNTQLKIVSPTHSGVHTETSYFTKQ